MGRGGTGWARFPGEINISIIFINAGIFIIVVVIIIVMLIIIRVIISVVIFNTYLHPDSQNFQGLHKDHLLILLWPNKKQYKEG